MAQHPRLNILVAYCSLQGAKPGVDPEFGVEVVWDIPLLEGYPWVEVPNKSPRPGLGRFFGLINPGLWELVGKGSFDAVVAIWATPMLVHGWFSPPQRGVVVPCSLGGCNHCPPVQSC